MSQFLHDRGTQKSKKDINSRPVLDKELFTTRMEAARKWNAQRSNQEWARLERDAANHYDDKGPAWAPKRLKIPGWLLGADMETDELESFERKSWQTSTKAQKDIAPEVAEKFVRETAQGLDAVVEPSRLEAATPLAASAATLEGGKAPVSACGLVAAAASAHLGSPKSSEASQAAGSSAASAASASVAASPTKGEKEKKARVDLPAFRSQRHRAIMLDIGTKTKDVLLQAATTAAQELDNGMQYKGEAEFVELAGRLECLLAALGARKPAGAETWHFCATTIDPQSPVEDEFLAKLLEAMRDLPVESAAKMLTLRTSETRAGAIAKMQQEAEIREATAAWEEQKSLLKQLAQAVKAAGKSFAKLSKDAAAAAEKKKKEEDNAEAKRQQQAKEQENASLTARARCKDAAVFAIPWHLHGHPRVGALAAGTPPTSLELPAVWEKAAAADADPKFDKACQAWFAQFPAACKTKAVNHVVAEMGKGHGPAVPQALFEEAANSAGGVLDIGAKMAWRGEAANSTTAAYAFNFSGIFRYQVRGSTRVLCISAADLLKGAPQIKGIPKMNLEDCRAFLGNYAADAKEADVEGKAKAAKDAGVLVYSGSLSPGQVLIVPAAWLLLAQCMDEPVASVTQAFVDKSEGTYTRTSTIVQELAAGQDKQKLEKVLDHLAVAHAQQAKGAGAAPASASGDSEGAGATPAGAPASAPEGAASTEAKDFAPQEKAKDNNANEALQQQPAVRAAGETRDAAGAEAKKAKAGAEAKKAAKKG